MLPSQAYQFARADHAESSQRARRVHLGLRYFTESILFTFLPASILQIGWLLLELVTLGRPDTTGKMVRADNYLRMLNTSFSVNFGLLAVWWATARIHAQEAGQADTQLQSGGEKKPIEARDMSMLDWALGPIAPEFGDAPTEEVNPSERGDQVEKLGLQDKEEKEQDACLRRRGQSTD